MQRSSGSAIKYRVGTKVTHFTVLGGSTINAAQSTSVTEQKKKTFLVCKSAHHSSFAANEHNLLLFLYVGKEEVTFKEGFSPFQGRWYKWQEDFTQRKKKTYLEPIKRRLCLHLHCT